MEQTALPFIIIVAIFGLAGFKQWIKYQTTKIQTFGVQQPSTVTDSTLAELRNEITQVRSVSNEYDLSIQHTLDQIQHRLDRLEAQAAAAKVHQSPMHVAQPAEMDQLIVGVNERQ